MVFCNYHLTDIFFNETAKNQYQLSNLNPPPPSHPMLVTEKAVVCYKCPESGNFISTDQHWLGGGVKIVNRPNTFVQDCRWTLFDGQCTLTDTTGHTLPPTLPSLKDTPVRTRTLVNELLWCPGSALLWTHGNQSWVLVPAVQKCLYFSLLQFSLFPVKIQCMLLH